MLHWWWREAGEDLTTLLHPSSHSDSTFFKLLRSLWQHLLHPSYLALTSLTSSFFPHSDSTYFILLTSLLQHLLHPSYLTLTALTSSFLPHSDSTFFILLTSLWHHFLHPSYSTYFILLTSLLQHFLHPSFLALTALTSLHFLLATGVHFPTLPMRLLSAEVLQLRQWWHVLGLRIMSMPSGPMLAASPSDPFAMCLCSLRLHR